MRKYLFCILACIVGLQSTVVAQSTEESKPETLFGGDVKIGGFGGFGAKFSGINGQAAVLPGGYGAVVFNKSLYIGLGGWGLANHIPLADQFQTPATVTRYADLWYSGLILGYVHNSDALIHVGGHILGGAGALGQRVRRSSMSDFDWFTEETELIFVIEPEVFVELNITSFMKVNIGGGYRFVQGAETNKITDLSMPYGNIAFKFGGGF